MIGAQAGNADDEGRHSDPRLDATIERLDGDPAIIDADDFSGVGLSMSRKANAIPELYELGQP
jgi:hypothetical protein